MVPFNYYNNKPVWHLHLFLHLRPLWEAETGRQIYIKFMRNWISSLIYVIEDDHIWEVGFPSSFNNIVWEPAVNLSNVLNTMLKLCRFISWIRKNWPGRDTAVATSTLKLFKTSKELLKLICFSSRNFKMLQFTCVNKKIKTILLVASNY